MHRVEVEEGPSQHLARSACKRRVRTVQTKTMGRAKACERGTMRGGSKRSERKARIKPLSSRKFVILVGFAACKIRAESRVTRYVTATVVSGEVLFAKSARGPIPPLLAA